jgi:hypothetical protein
MGSDSLVFSSAAAWQSMAKPNGFVNREFLRSESVDFQRNPGASSSINVNAHRVIRSGFCFAAFERWTRIFGPIASEIGPHFQ